MIDFSEYNEEKEKYIGNPFNCKFVRVSIKEYLSSSNGEYNLSQIKFFFLRKDPYLIAIQFLFQKKEEFGSKDPSSFISFKEKNNNKYIGGIYNKYELENIEEYTLQLSLGEEICIFSGNYKNDLFHKINIKTNFGKFFLIGNKKVENNFSFKYFYNGIFFDGLVIGADTEKIMYLKPIIYEDKLKFDQAKINHENKHKKELIDVSEDLTILTKYSPIYKTNIFGTNNSKTIIIDDMEKSGLIMEIKEGRAALNKITVWSNGKRITKINNEYTHFINKEKNISISHESNSYDIRDSNYIIVISKEDHIKDAIVYLSSRKKNVKNIEITTSKGMKLKTSNHKGHNYKELTETTGKKLRILGMCVGREKYIQFIQFYYDLTNSEI